MKLLCIAEVARRLGVSPRTVYHYLRDGKLKGTKLAGKTWRINPADLREFVKQKEVTYESNADQL
mgnify:FL=1